MLIYCLFLIFFFGFCFNSCYSLERVVFGTLFVTFDIFGENFTLLIWHRYC